MTVTHRESTVTTATSKDGEISVDSSPGEDVTIKISDYESHAITLDRESAKQFFAILMDVV